jgi:single-stranded-DNA-specific exonuclease
MLNLNTDKSVMGLEWKLNEGTLENGEPIYLRSGKQVSDKVVKIIAGRGITRIQEWLEPKLVDWMPDSYVLANMQEAVEVFTDNLKQGKKIALLGDYDVDGATSTAQVILWCRMAGLEEPIFHIPNREKEGYGPKIPAIEALRAKGAELLVILDSGTLSINEVARAKEIGMQVIIFDHHEPGEGHHVLPDGILVNPKLPINKEAGLDYLCTAGLVFLFLAGLNRHLIRLGDFNEARPAPNLKELMGVVALGTVADLVPLKGLNRAYVKLGLDKISLNTGLDSLYRVTKADDFSTKTCAFGLAPCINAAGRLEDSTRGTYLIMESDVEQANELSRRLMELNIERKKIQDDAVLECISVVETFNILPSIIVLYDENWHPGVIGIVAAKLKERYDRPTIIIGHGGKGSGRSIKGFNLGNALIEAKEHGILVAGGGHAAAAGLTITAENVPVLREFLSRKTDVMVRPPLKVDLSIEMADITMEDVEDFEMMAPFGKGNSKPSVVIKNGVLTNVFEMSGKHLKGILEHKGQKMDVMLFSGLGTPLGDALLRAKGYQVDIMGEMKVKLWNGTRKNQILLKDLMLIKAVMTDAITDKAA